MSVAETTDGRLVKGWHVFAVLAGCFALVFIVNGILAYEAISTFSGLEGADPYRAGLNYNETLAQAQKQQLLGWHTAVVGFKDGSGVAATFTDAANQPVAGLHIEAVLTRPATQSFDKPLAFHETAPGHYEAPAAADIAQGNWVVNLTASDNGTGDTRKVYHLKERIWLKRN